MVEIIKHSGEKAFIGFISREEKPWLVNEFNEFLSIINEIYNSLISAAINYHALCRIIERSRNEFQEENLDKKQINKMVNEYFPLEQIENNLDDYIPKELFLSIRHIEMSNPVEIDFKGIAEVIEALDRFLSRRELKKIREFLELQNEFGNHPVLSKYLTGLMIDLEFKNLKKRNKVEKYKKKKGLKSKTPREVF